MATLRAFLHSRRVSDSSWNITGMGQDMGKYYVSSEDYPTLFQLIHTEVLQHRHPCHLLERHAPYSPILIDLDFRYSVDIQERTFTKRHIQEFLKVYSDAFYHFFDYKESLRFFVMLRPELVEEKGKVKDGVHILCGDLTLPPHIQQTLRSYTLEKGCVSMFADRINSDEDCFDASVIQKNNWFFYGASKPNHEPYIVDYCYVCTPDTIEEAEWIETDDGFLELFSLQYKRDVCTNLLLRKEVEDEWQTWESIACGNIAPNKKDTKKATEPKDTKDDVSVCSTMSNHICKILKLNGYDWKVDECEDGYKLTHNTKDCLVLAGAAHTTAGHSCVFVQKNHAILSCFSHQTLKLPKSKSEALWKLLANDEDDYESSYAKLKEQFEASHFRVLNPPGYMTKIDDSWVHYTRQQLIDMNSGLFLDDSKKERFIDWWLRDNTIRTYSKIGYFVDTSECPTTVFNTFTGFAAERLLENYIPSGLETVLRHVRILCNHSEEAYEFVLDWFALLLQRPGFLNGICIIFKGKHGCGKDMFLSWFGTRIVGLQNYYKTARPHIDLFGAFNSSRKDIVFYHIEEGSDAVFKDVNLQQFKNYITDSYASIQLKQKNTTAADSLVKNYNHFAISTNHVISCEMNERRFFGVEASSEMCKHPEYFTALAAAMDDTHIIASFYEFLKRRDIGRRNWADLPETDYMKEMRSAAVPELYHFLEEFVEAYDEETIIIQAADFYNTYCDWHSLHGDGKVKNHIVFGKEAKLIKGIQRISDRRGNLYEINKLAILNK